VLVSDLIQVLSRMPKSATVVVAGEIPIGLTTVRGRLQEGGLNEQFVRNDKGKMEAVMFTHHAELSDGSIELVVM
jgi:hypothetical protein